MTIQQSHLFSECLNQITEGIMVIDQDGNVESCNLAIERMFGFSEAELINKSIYQMLLPQNSNSICQKWISDQLKRLSKKQYAQTFHFTANRLNQQQFPVLFTISSLLSKGYSSFVVTIKDISEQQLLVDNKEELETRLQRESLMRHLAGMINESLDLHEIMNTTVREVGQFFNADYVTILRHYFNSDTQLFEDLTMTGYCSNPELDPMWKEEINRGLELLRVLWSGMTRESAKAFLGKGPVKNFSNSALNEKLNQRQQLITALEGEAKQEVFREYVSHVEMMKKKYNLHATLFAAIEYKGISYGQILLTDEDANRVWTEDEHVLVQFVADQLGGAFAQSELYTLEQKARQEAEIANRRKSEFLGMMSHELRTPLNAIIGYSNMTLKGMAGALNEKQIMYIENVFSSGNHLLAIVNDLLDVSQIETGKLAIHPICFELKPLLDNIQLMMQEMAGKKQIKLFFDIASDLDAVKADQARFKQILINLLGNAIKFNREQGSVFLRLYYSLDKQWLIGEIEDTGIGIPQETQNNLFTKFYQVDSRVARTYEGTGLGLVLTKELVELHGGVIQVTSIEGQGSTFIFKLPIPT